MRRYSFFGKPYSIFGKDFNRKVHKRKCKERSVFILRALFHFTLYAKVIYDSSLVFLTKPIPEIKKIIPNTP